MNFFKKRGRPLCRCLEGPKSFAGGNKGFPSGEQERITQTDREEKRIIVF